MRDGDRVAELLAEYFERVSAGEALQPEAFLASHPDVADALREHLEFAPVVDEVFTPETPVPEQLGPYRVLEVLGTGGMGTVYRASVEAGVEQVDAATDVALKLVHPHLLQRPGFFKRFLREAQVGQSVEHANVVRTFDVDALMQDATPYHYLVMEYVEGQTLRGLLDELEVVPEELCRHIGREVAKGLVAIHEASVVHRDLKPDNVIITEDHVVKVMDLGVARLADEAIRLSQTGHFIGSVEYAAPEQFTSAKEGVDARSDLFALGVVLYELATGRHPFRDESARVVLHRVLEEPARKIGELNPQLSPFLEELVDALLRKRPDERFQTAAHLLEVLEQGEGGAWWRERATQLHLQTQRPLRRIRVPRETALYGRDEDLQKLEDLHEQAKAGDGQVLLIEGEAGIGKTRLVDEFVGRLRQQGEDISFLFGSYPPGGAATAAGAFSTAYREHYGSADLEEALRSCLTDTPILVPAFAALLRGDITPQDAEPLTKDSLQTVFIQMTRSLAAERPTIVLVDDLHFAPEEGRALFASLALAVPGHRVLLVGTMRPGVSETWTAGVTRLEHAALVDLGRLGPKDLGRLLRDAFGSERLAEELGWRIAQKSDGNPFFAFEIIRGLKEGQFLAQKPDGTWATTRIIDEIQVPSTVLDLVNARVADLTSDERDLLDVAACCGFEFDAVLVAEAAGMDRIVALKRFGLIERGYRLVRSVGRRLTFDHHQVQEALYAGILEPLREHYHATIAEALEAREGARAQEPEELDGALCVDLCEHYFRGDRGKSALRYLDAALTYFERGFLNDQAVTLADRALDVPGLLEREERLAVLLRKNGRLDLLGRREAQQSVLEEAGTLLEAAPTRAWRAKVERARGTLFLRRGRTAEACGQFELHLASAREVWDVHGQAAAAIGLGNALNSLGRYDEALEHLEHGLAQAREIEDAWLQSTATGNMGLVLRSLGRLDEARAHAERHLALALKIGDREGESRATGNLGTVYWDLGDQAKAREHYERLLMLSRKIGYRQGEAVAVGNLGIVLRTLGRLAEAREHAERHLALAREMGDKDLEAAATINLGSVLLSLGKPEEARSLFERGRRLSIECGNRRWEANAVGNLGSLLHRTGHYAEAREYLEGHLTITKEIGDRSGEVGAAGNLGNLLLSLGCLSKAREQYERQLALSREIGARREEGVALSHLASLAAEEGDGAGAVRLAEEGLAICRQTEHGDGVVDSLINLGIFHWTAGDPAPSREALEEAVARSGEQTQGTESALPLAVLACLPGGDVEGTVAALADAGAGEHRLEVRYFLWKASRDPEHLTEAKRLLDQLVEHAPEECRDTMLENVRLHREITVASEATHSG